MEMLLNFLKAHLSDEAVHVVDNIIKEEVRVTGKQAETAVTHKDQRNTKTEGEGGGSDTSGVGGDAVRGVEDRIKNASVNANRKHRRSEGA